MESHACEPQNFIFITVSHQLQLEWKQKSNFNLTLLETFEYQRENSKSDCFSFDDFSMNQLFINFMFYNQKVSPIRNWNTSCSFLDRMTLIFRKLSGRGASVQENRFSIDNRNSVVQCSINTSPQGDVFSNFWQLFWNENLLLWTKKFGKDSRWFLYQEISLEGSFNRWFVNDLKSKLFFILLNSSPSLWFSYRVINEFFSQFFWHRTFWSVTLYAHAYFMFKL